MPTRGLGGTVIASSKWLVSGLFHKYRYKIIWKSYMCIEHNRMPAEKYVMTNHFSKTDSIQHISARLKRSHLIHGTYIAGFKFPRIHASYK